MLNDIRDLIFSISLVINLICIPILLGVALDLRDDARSLRFKAVSYGYARYSVDANGITSFTWIIPAETTPVASGCR